MSKSRAIQQLFQQPDAREFLPLEFGVRPNSAPQAPTAEVTAEWQRAFDRFNTEFFEGALSRCLITFNQSTDAMGYFCPNSIRNDQGETAHEIAINLNWVATLGVVEGLSTMAHEMTHLWCHLCGERNRKGGLGAHGYHDLPWSKRMEAIGLMPSHTGKPGGKRTGYQMSEYVIPGGPFDIVTRELLLAGETVRWLGAHPLKLQPINVSAPAPHPRPVAPARKRKGKTGFACPTCPTKVWGMASVRVACINCNNAPMTPR
jgi:hypothetical protein